jgi:CRISPR-associated protein Csb2
MGLAIAFRFLSGRFHATPWDRHPNEGVAEWPPAPWRVLRALVAAAYRADGDPNLATLDQVLAALGTAPQYRLPLATTAHTRSYQPLYEGKTTLVLDAFVVVGGGADDEAASVVVEWPEAELDPPLLAVLDRWLASLGYLGRAESWVEARRVNISADPPTVAPLASVLEPCEVFRALTPANGDAPTLRLSLVTDTASLFADCRAEPTHARWATYAFRASPFASPPLRRSQRQSVREVPTVIRLALGARVLPRLVDAVRFGDRVRSALMSRSRDEAGLPHPVFSGKDAEGRPLGGNGHTHVLPLDEDRDGRIDHVLLWAPSGFDERAMAAVAGFEWMWGDESFDLRVSYTGSGIPKGRPEAFGVPQGSRVRNPLAISLRWQSRTPFVLMRHPKVRAGMVVDGPEHQLRREFARLGLPAVVSMVPIAGTDAPDAVAWHRFRLMRTAGGGSRGSHRGYGFAVAFESPVTGPLVVGYGARQGLGQFEPSS